jgi:hypothetical protein
MDRNLCLNREDKLLYKVICEAIDAICGIPLIAYHYIEDNSLIYVVPEKYFNKKFVRLKR